MSHCAFCFCSDAKRKNDIRICSLGSMIPASVLAHGAKRKCLSGMGMFSACAWRMAHGAWHMVHVDVDMKYVYMQLVV